MPRGPAYFAMAIMLAVSYLGYTKMVSPSTEQPAAAPQLEVDDPPVHWRPLNKIDPPTPLRSNGLVRVLHHSTIEDSGIEAFTGSAHIIERWNEREFTGVVLALPDETSSREFWNGLEVSIGSERYMVLAPQSAYTPAADLPWDFIGGPCTTTIGEFSVYQPVLDPWDHRWTMSKWNAAYQAGEITQEVWEECPVDEFWGPISEGQSKAVREIFDYVNSYGD